MKTSFGNDIQVKPFTENDRYQVAALLRDVLVEHGVLENQGELSAEMARLQRRYSASDAVFWVLFHKGEVAGTIALRPQGEYTAEIENFFLKWNIRGCGIGQKLLSFVEDYAYEAGYRRLFVSCLKALPAGIEFLEKMDYRRIGNPDQESDAELFEKELF